jgi:phage-related protein
MALKNLLVRVGADISGLQKGMKNAQKNVSGFTSAISSSLKGLGALMASIGAGMTLGAGIKDAMEFEAHIGTLNQTLGESTKGFTQWMNTTGTALGLSKLQLAKYGNQYSLTLKGIAKDQEDLAKKTQKTIEAVALIRTKTGMDVVEISDRMRSAMNGEADGADELGVNVRVAAITASKAYQQMANGKPWDQLSANMQKAIRWQYTMDTITGNLGDTMANNTALKMSVFTSSLLNMRMAMGQAWLPILNVALPALTKLSNALTKVFSTFAQFMSVLFGYKPDNGSGPAAQAKATDQLKDSVSGVGDAYKKAGKEAKKAKGSLAGFDEVNTLADKAGAATGEDQVGQPGDSGGGIFPNMGENEGAIDKISEKMKKFAEKTKEWLGKAATFLKSVFVPVLDYLKEKLGVLSDYWKENSSQIMQALKNVYNFLKPIVTFIVKLIWNDIKGAIDGLLKMVLGIVSFFTGVFTGDWKMAWEGLKDIVLGAIKAIWHILNLVFIGGILKGFKLAFAGVKGLVKTFGDDIVKGFLNITKFAKDWVVKLGSSIINGIGNMVKGVGNFFTKMWDQASRIFGILKGFGESTMTALFNTIKSVFKNVLDDITKIASDIWNAVKKPFVGAKDWFVTKFSEISTALADSNLLSKVFSGAKGVLDKVKGVFTGIKDWFVTKFSEISTALGDGNLLSKVFTGAKLVLDKVKGAFTGIKEWFASKFSDISKALMDGTFLGNIRNAATKVLDAIKGVFNTLKTWFDTNVKNKIVKSLGEIKDGFKEGIASGLKAVLNQFIGMFNDAIAVMNKFKNKVPLANKLPDIPTLPKLRRGGIVDTATNFGNYIAGEAGAEMVVPLENTSFVDKLASALGTAVSNAMATSNGNGDIVLKVGEHEFGRIAARSINKAQRTAGKLLIDL